MSSTQKFLAFTLTFLAYAGLHCIREGWSYSKKQIGDQFNVTNPQFGLIDTLYLFSYSFGMATIGNLSNRMNLKYFIGVGMLLSAVFYMSFSIYYVAVKEFSYVFMVIAMCLNGFFQSTGWPGAVGVIGNWFGKGKRGMLMGFWAINANVGNILALVLLNILDQQNKLPWTTNFFATGGFCLAIAVLCLVVLKQRPGTVRDDKLIEQPNNSSQPIMQQQKDKSILTENALTQQPQPQPISQRQINVFTALLLPRVPFYVIGYSCTKGCIYGLLFWLPTYLDNKGMQEQKGYIASMVDVGSFVGGMIVGYLGDRYSFRALFLSPFLFLAAAVMFIVSYALESAEWTYYIAMFLIGVLTGGPYNIIGTAITIDIGQQVGKKNIAKVSALIEGSAAVFAAVSQIVISHMPFQGIFYLFCGECLLSALSLLPLFLKDLKSLRKN